MYSGLTFTTVQPARRMPNRHTGYCRMLGIISAMRAPFLKPCPCSHAPNADESVSSSANVMLLPMHVNDGRAAYVAHASSNTSRTDAYSLTSMVAGMPRG